MIISEDISECAQVWFGIFLSMHLQKKVGPGTDMEAIKAHLSQYGNNHEELALIEDLAVLHHHPDLKYLEPWYAFIKLVWTSLNNPS